MFATLESFSIFFFTCLALIILGIIFEEKLIAFEEKTDKKIVQRKKAKRKAEIKKSRVQHEAPNSCRPDNKRQKISAAA